MAALFVGGLVATGCAAFGQVNQPPPGNGQDNEIRPDEIEPELFKTEKHQIAFSGDYLVGFGELALPFELGLQSSILQTLTAPHVTLGERESTYLGGTISYSYGLNWYADFSYSRGDSTATSAEILSGLAGDVDYQIEDSWYQLYIRYAFPQLRGKRVSAYLRFGGTWVDTQLTADGVFLPSFYEQTTDMTDRTGNAGFGLAYSFYSGARVRISGIVEGEGFAGLRSQKISEAVILPEEFGREPIVGKENIDNLLYGGLGRSTIRFELFPATGQWRIFADAGVQARYTIVEYDTIDRFDGGSFDELLWGPYVRAGLKYSF